ncbi:hypothetical protein [Henriciella sp.]|uniref:hypothetical protein n=1 Tax=Henriciella sp. TaxID=1968823 RepID=UPI0026305BFF|nr:hypothetical protein [Henriciella sp.]
MTVKLYPFTESEISRFAGTSEEDRAKRAKARAERLREREADLRAEADRIAETAETYEEVAYRATWRAEIRDTLEEDGLEAARDLAQHDPSSLRRVLLRHGSDNLRPAPQGLAEALDINGRKS